MSTITLTGPNGGELLGFLTGIGALRVLTERRPDLDPRLSWRWEDLGWRPVIHLNDDHDAGAVVAAEVAGFLGDPVRRPRFQPVVGGTALTHINKADSAAWRDFLTHTARLATVANRVQADAAAGWWTDGGITEYSLLNDQGNQRLFERMVQFLDWEGGATHDEVAASLMRPWSYRCPHKGLRLDAGEDASAAFAASPDPGAKKASADAKKKDVAAAKRAGKGKTPPSDPGGSDDEVDAGRGTERVATLLAFLAFADVPVVPGAGEPSTVTVLGKRHIWPIWEPPARPATVRALLSHPDLARASRRRRDLQALGVVAVLAARRYMPTKGNLYVAPARAIW